MSHRGQLSCLNAQPMAYHSHSMTPSSHAPVTKMAPSRTASQDSSADGIRKRVCKACDRCRLKKSKCDGSSPCTRCKTDNAICVFGERKKSHDKVYPKGYVEMLEQQQAQLVSGLVELYERLLKAEAWTGPPVEEHDGKPYTHHILAALDLLETRDGSAVEFEEDTDKLQAKLIADGAGMAGHARRSSISSDSEHSQHSHARSQSQSHGTPQVSQPASLFKEEFKFGVNSEPSSPPAASPVHRSQRHPFQQPPQPSPLQHSSPVEEDPNIFQPEWQNYPPANDHKFAPQQMMRSDFAMQAPSMHQQASMHGLPTSFQQWDAPQDFSFEMMPEPMPAYFDPSMNAFHNSRGPEVPGMHVPQDMDFEFGSFVSVQT
ncbi:hypothetical protein BST61_g2393 [Cercospora zeina]